MKDKYYERNLDNPIFTQSLLTHFIGNYRLGIRELYKTMTMDMPTSPSAHLGQVIHKIIETQEIPNLDVTIEVPKLQKVKDVLNRHYELTQNDRLKKDSILQACEEVNYLQSYKSDTRVDKIMKYQLYYSKLIEGTTDTILDDKQLSLLNPFLNTWEDSKLVKLYLDQEKEGKVLKEHVMFNKQETAKGKADRIILKDKEIQLWDIKTTQKSYEEYIEGRYLQDTYIYKALVLHQAVFYTYLIMEEFGLSKSDLKNISPNILLICLDPILPTYSIVNIEPLLNWHNITWEQLYKELSNEIFTCMNKFFKLVKLLKDDKGYLDIVYDYKDE